MSQPTNTTGDTLYIYFTTHDRNGAAVAPSDAFEAADVRIYKDGSNVQKTTTNGITMTSPFDSLTGLHLLTADTSVSTGDTGFWANGHVYTFVLSPDTETVDSQTVIRVLDQRALVPSPPDVNVVKIAGTDQTAGDYGALLAAIKVKTDKSLKG